MLDIILDKIQEERIRNSCGRYILVLIVSYGVLMSVINREIQGKSLGGKLSIGYWEGETKLLRFLEGIKFLGSAYNLVTLLSFSL